MNGYDRYERVILNQTRKVEKRVINQTAIASRNLFPANSRRLMAKIEIPARWDCSEGEFIMDIETNPIYSQINDLQGRLEALRGYL